MWESITEEKTRMADKQKNDQPTKKIGAYVHKNGKVYWVKRMVVCTYEDCYKYLNSEQIYFLADGIKIIKFLENNEIIRTFINRNAIIRITEVIERGGNNE